MDTDVVKFEKPEAFITNVPAVMDRFPFKRECHLVSIIG